jgi:DNA-binding PadR family transcriptional regulator
MLLSLLSVGPAHGYALARRLEESSGGVLAVEEGSLYPALQRLLKRDLVEAKWSKQVSGRDIRVYTLTAAGRRELKASGPTWCRAIRAVQSVIESPTERFRALPI